MIEVLVAMLIISLGLLGIGGITAAMLVQAIHKHPARLGDQLAEVGGRVDLAAVADADAAAQLTGAGKAFCAGLDLRELGSEGVPTLGDASDPVRALAAFGKPVIAAVNGAAVTGGFELALACDVLLASTEARFADTHARIGVIPGWGLSQKLSRLIGLPRAKEMAFSGNFIDAETAERWGLVNRVLSPDALLGRRGQKDGKGWYLYAPGDRKPQRDPAFEQWLVETQQANN